MANDNVLVSAATLTKIGDAIRAKGGTTAKIKPADMPTAIANIKIPNVRRKINIVNPSPDKQIVHVDYLQDPVSITESTVVDTSPRIHSYVWATQGYKAGVLNIKPIHKLTEDEITIAASYPIEQYQKGDKVSLDEYYKQIIGDNLTELPEVNANYLKSVYPTSMNDFFHFRSSSSLFGSGCTIDLRELDTRFCTSLNAAFYNIESSIIERNIKILGIESFDVSNVTDFSECFFYNEYYTDASTVNLDLSKWDVRKGTNFNDFIGYMNILDISSFGENEALNSGKTEITIVATQNLIIDGKYVSIYNGLTYYTGITNLYATHNLLNRYKNKLGNFVKNYKPCEKLIKATIPEGYAISFNDSIAPEQDGIAYIPYKTTKATYCMINPNYLPVTGEIDVSAMARSEEKDISLENIEKDTSGNTLTVNVTPTNATVKFTYKGATLISNKIMVPANAEVNVEITCSNYEPIIKTVTVTQKSQIDNNTMKKYKAEHANFANNYTFSNVESTLLDNDNFAIDTDKKCLYNKKAYNVNNGISTGYIHISANTFDKEMTLKVSVRTNAEIRYDTGVILVGNANYTINGTFRRTETEGSEVTLVSNKYTLLYNSINRNETTFRTVSTTLKANTEYYIIFAYTKDDSSNIYEDAMFIQSIDIE